MKEPPIRETKVVFWKRMNWANEGITNKTEKEREGERGRELQAKGPDEGKRRKTKSRKIAV